MTAAKAALAEYLDSAQLDSRQIYFVNQIVEYIVHNGMMKDQSSDIQQVNCSTRTVWHFLGQNEPVLSEDPNR